MELFEEDYNTQKESGHKLYLKDTPGIVEDFSAIFELSIDAFFAATYASMSELPIAEELKRYIEKVKKAGGGGDRTAASRAALDRGDPDVLAVLRVSHKVMVEIHRLTGLLRFEADGSGVYIARCSPDHFVLPALAEHFTLRFGETPWAIVDEKRRICLKSEKGAPARLLPYSENSTAPEGKDDRWEGLWRLYHRSINNEARKNPRLQRQFMPERYHKYLPEMK